MCKILGYNVKVEKLRNVYFLSAGEEIINGLGIAHSDFKTAKLIAEIQIKKMMNIQTEEVA